MKPYFTKMDDIGKPLRPAQIERMQANVAQAESIMKDRKKILACAAYLEGEYGINGLFIGVPVKLGKGGIEEIIQIKLTAEEDAALKKSAAAVRELVDTMKKMA